MLFLQLCRLPDFQCSFLGEQFSDRLSYDGVGSGDLTVEFDALFELSVPIEPDALIEISVPIFGRLATPEYSVDCLAGVS